MAGDVRKHIEAFSNFIYSLFVRKFCPIEIDRLSETNTKFTTSTTVNIFNDPKLVTIHEQHDCQSYELFRKYEQSIPELSISPVRSHSTCLSIETPQTPANTDSNDISEDLKLLIEQRLPDLCHLDGELMEFVNGLELFSIRKLVIRMNI